MAENKSSASHEQIMPAGKPSTSFVTDSSKTGEYGDRPISCKSLPPLAGSNKQKMTEEFSSKTSMDEVSGMMIEPQGEPSSTFINTSAVK